MEILSEKDIRYINKPFSKKDLEYIKSKSSFFSNLNFKKVKLQEFKVKKYWDKLVDSKKLIRDFNENEKKRKKFFAWNWKDIVLKSVIVW